VPIQMAGSASMMPASGCCLSSLGLGPGRGLHSSVAYWQSSGIT
jgi:hypothetical protein